MEYILLWRSQVFCYLWLRLWEILQIAAPLRKICGLFGGDKWRDEGIMWCIPLNQLGNGEYSCIYNNYWVLPRYPVLFSLPVINSHLISNPYYIPFLPTEKTKAQRHYITKHIEWWCQDMNLGNLTPTVKSLITSLGIFRFCIYIRLLRTSYSFGSWLLLSHYQTDVRKETVSTFKMAIH